MYFASVQMVVLGWRDGSVIKCTVCSSRGCKLNSQEPRGGSQPLDALFWNKGVHGNMSDKQHNKSFKKKEMFV